MHNLSCENEFYLHENDFHIKGWAPTLVLKQKPGGTPKWTIGPVKWETYWKKSFLANVYEYSTERQECKTFCARIPGLIGHYTNEQLGLLDIFSTSNQPAGSSNPFLFAPHFYFVPTCIYYSNYVYKSTFNATPIYNVMTLLNLILLSIESYREFKCG